tara:strand:- start:5458 stop:7227 length:1770 start_codon:yes stop_codon:yes gene_type:complete
MSIFLKTYKLIPENLRLFFFFLIFLMIISVILETLGIALLLPTIAVILDPESISRYPSINELFQPLRSFISDTTIFLLFLLMSFYFLKAIFIAIVSFLQAKFVYQMKALISQDLFKKYTNYSFETYLNLDSSNLIRNISTEVIRFIDGILKQILFLIVELFIVIGMFIFLIILNPLIILVTVSVFFIVGFSYYYLTKNRLLVWGEKRQNLESRKIETLQQSILGIKELKVFQRETQFNKIFKDDNYDSANAEKNQFFVALMPRILLEFTAIAAVVFTILILFYQEANPSEIIPVIGIYVAATFKMLPSIQKVTHAIQQLRFEKPVLDLIYDEIKSAPIISKGKNIKLYKDTKGLNLSKNNNLVISNINFSYFKSNEPALTDINININAGETIGIIGESGSGKTTLINIILGLLTPLDGSIYFDNKDCLTNLSKWRNQISFVPQNIFISNRSLKQNIAFGVEHSLIDKEKVIESINMAQLSELITNKEGSIEMILGERGSKLSGGQIQRVGIARALYKDPKVLIFDEATSSLDSTTENEVMDSIYNLPGKRIKIIIAHRTSTLNRTNRIFEIIKGRIARETNYSEIIKSK